MISRKTQILILSLFALVSFALWVPDVEAFQSFNASPDCSVCHYPDPPYNCATCHTIFSGGPASEGHSAHFNIGLPQLCYACHIDIGDDPLTSTCTPCHLQMGLANHHDRAPVSPPFYQTENGRCWMCHNGPNVPEDTIPPGYEGTCLNPCDGSEELFTYGSFTTSLDNDGDLLIDSSDPDCAVCNPTVRVMGTPPVDYAILQDAFNEANEDDILRGNKTPFHEDIQINLGKSVYFEGGFNCNLISITGKSTIKSITISDGLFILKSGALQIQTPAEECDDYEDNDDDELIDCGDPDCDNDPACSPPTEDVCNDCVDNDGNGFIDCADTSCSDDPSCSFSFEICTACHGDPPVDASTLVILNPGTGSMTAGAHAPHVITELYECKSCHSGSVGEGPTHINGFRVTMGFSPLGGSYDGQTTVQYDSSEVNTSVSNTGSMTCSTIYCHSNVQSANGTAVPDTYASPMWDATSVACDSCHGQATQTDGQPDTGSHDKHAGELNYDCSACHINGGEGTSNHADEMINIDLDDIYDDGGTAAYSQGDHLYGTNGYGTCSNVGCHIGTVTPIWGGSLPNEADCSDCHGSDRGTITGQGEMASGMHQQHIANTDSGLGSFDCGRCHNETVTAGDNKTITGARHANLSDDVYYDSLNPSASANTCNAVYCHSDGKGGYNNQELATAWESGSAIGCNGCHGDTTSSYGEPDYANSGPGTEFANDHNTHSEASICFYCHYMTTMDGVTIVAGSEKHINTSREVDVHSIFNGQCSDTSFYNEFDCLANGGIWTPEVFSYDDQTKTCSNVICHSNSVQWGDDPANVTSVCGVCHETPPLDAVGDGQPHTIHFGIGNEGYVPDVYGERNIGATETNYGFYCGFCHPWSAEEHQNDPSAGTTVDPKHMEIWLGAFYRFGEPVPGGGPLTRGGTPIYDVTLATENVDPGIAKDNTGTPVFYYAYHDGTCMNISCHSDGRGADPLHTPTWKLGDKPGDCTYCHGNDASSASTIATGSHEAHIVNGGYGCSECHYGTVTDNRTIKDKRKHVSNGFNALTGEPVAAGEAFDLQPDPQEFFVYSYSPNGSQCAAISCHSDTDAIWGDPDSVNCNTCHAMGTADVDDFIYDNGTRAEIDRTEWESVGHGSGTAYIGSGNPGANFTSCYYCHDSEATHGDAENPFRLINNSGSEGQNGVCLACHKTGAAGYDPDGGGPLPLKVGGLNVDSYHYGPLHASGNNGGQYCWDCHEPHGDSNIFMVHDDVTTQSDGVYGIPLTTNSVTFLANSTGADYAKSSSPFDGICNSCHTSTDHYTSSSGDGHNASVRCIYCHDHTGESEFLAFEPLGECDVCHGEPPVTSSSGGPDGLVGVPGTTGAATPGVHALHATAQEWTVNRTYIRYLQPFPNYELVTEPTLKKGYDFPCETCHEGGMTILDLSLDNDIQIGGSIITYGGNRILNPPYTFAGTQFSYKGAAPPDQNDPARPMVTGDVILSGSDMKCTTYCHSDGDAIYNGLVDTGVKSPAWGSVDSATSSLPCDACHGYPPENGSAQFSSHGKHVESWRYTCDKCHYETTEDGITITNPAKHGDGNIDVAPHPGKSEFRYLFTPGGGGSCFYQPGGTQWPYVGCHLIDNPDSGLYGMHGPYTWQRFD